MGESKHTRPYLSLKRIQFPQMKPEPAKKKTLKEMWNEARGSVKGMTFKDVKAAFKDTVQDIKKDPKEKAIFAAGVAVPFGFLGYGAYRAEKYRRKKAANDNLKKPEGKKPEGPKR